MGVASSAPSPLLLIRQAGAGLQLLGHLGKQVAALLSRTQNHQEHAGVERRLGILAGSLIQVAHPVEQVCVDELHLAGHIGGSGKGVASFVVYAVLVIAYAVLRIWKAIRDKRAHAQQSEMPAVAGAVSE